MKRATSTRARLGRVRMSLLVGVGALAVVAAMLPVFLGETTLNIYSQIGLVTLIGLIAKNGILIVEFANQLQRQGLEKIDAVRSAALTRLRPIVMTTMATVLGHFPLVLVTGAGAQARNSIGLVLVGGMAIGTICTLFIVPSLYMLIAKQQNAPTTPPTEA